jgi:hypothetical protein
MAYYNTTHLRTVEELTKAMQQNDKQNGQVLACFEIMHVTSLDTAFDKDAHLSAEMVHHMLNEKGHVYPITSIRRAITDLTRSGYIRKTPLQFKSKYGKRCYTWRLNEEKLMGLDLTDAYEQSIADSQETNTLI